MIAGASIMASDMRDLQAQVNGFTLSRSTGFVQKLAAALASTLTVLARDAFARKLSVYDDPRTHHTGKPRKFKGRKFKGRSPSGHSKGQTPLTLVLTGKVQSFVRFTSDGTRRIRAELATKYARYLIGKYGVLPNSRVAMPVKWSAIIGDITAHMFANLAETLGE